ncbi:MAG TPA: DUF3553 domain-containing protein [Vicinamibacteria bacterium]|nr:DUF3553 domain-containing protein [Vicinamibacteria bacterium]
MRGPVVVGAVVRDSEHPEDGVGSVESLTGGVALVKFAKRQANVPVERLHGFDTKVTPLF